MKNIQICLASLREGFQEEALPKSWNWPNLCQEVSRESVELKSIEEESQRYILHTHGPCAKGAKADVKIKLTLDDPTHFKIQLFLCSFLLYIFKSFQIIPRCCIPIFDGFLSLLLTWLECEYAGASASSRLVLRRYFLMTKVG